MNWSVLSSCLIKKKGIKEWTNKLWAGAKLIVISLSESKLRFSLLQFFWRNEIDVVQVSGRERWKQLQNSAIIGQKFLLDILLGSPEPPPPDVIFPYAHAVTCDNKCFEHRPWPLMVLALLGPQDWTLTKKSESGQTRGEEACCQNENYHKFHYWVLNKIKPFLWNNASSLYCT